MWGWLGTDAVTANNTYARFLPKNSYSVSTGEGNRTTAPASAGVEMENSRGTHEKVGVCTSENGRSTVGVAPVCTYM